MHIFSILSTANRVVDIDFSSFYFLSTHLSPVKWVSE